MSIALSRRPRPLKHSPPLPVSEASMPQATAGDDEAALDHWIDETIDEQGMPRGGRLHRALPLFATWTKSLAADRAAGVFDPHEYDLYHKFVECLLRLTRRVGSLVFCIGESPTAEHREAWRAAAQLVEGRLRNTITGVLRGRSLDARPLSSRERSGDSPPASANSEPAGLAVLRPTWSAPRLVVDYHGSQLRLDLDRRGQPLIVGACTPLLTIDGAPLAPRSRWEQTCWITDEDVDYLEVELTLTGEVRVQRHLLFARQDEFVFIADAVLGSQPAAIDYQMTLPLAADVVAETAGETREIALAINGRRCARILPLGLSEWRSERRRGNLSVGEGVLELRQAAANASNHFAAWFIDLAPRRLSRPVTWRQLTVAEDREIQPDDVAVGYRVQIGSRQWLFYRSLAACGNRTLLGHNLVSEFLAARFSRRGVPETLIEIEAPSDHDG
jgi:hypothetical protein